MAELKAEDFERGVRLKGVSLIALKGVMNYKIAPKDMIFGALGDDKEDLTIPLHEFIMPGQFGRLVDNCYDLPDKSHVGDLRATKNGEVWIRAVNSWVYITNAPGVR